MPACCSPLSRPMQEKMARQGYLPRVARDVMEVVPPGDAIMAGIVPMYSSGNRDWPMAGHAIASSRSFKSSACPACRVMLGNLSRKAFDAGDNRPVAGCRPHASLARPASLFWCIRPSMTRRWQELPKRRRQSSGRPPETPSGPRRYRPQFYQIFRCKRFIILGGQEHSPGHAGRVPFNRRHFQRRAQTVGQTVTIGEHAASCLIDEGGVAGILRNDIFRRQHIINNLVHRLCIIPDLAWQGTEKGCHSGAGTPAPDPARSCR